ncbi:MAG: hypothetical protein ACRCST_13005 [Turicibacter sp.]
MVETQTKESYFDGGLLSLIGVSILAFFMTTFSFGILYPWALCISFGWKINHTVVEGRRLKFIGQPFDLFFNWLKWLFFCIITFGIYGFWLSIALEKWKVKNTVFVD